MSSPHPAVAVARWFERSAMPLDAAERDAIAGVLARHAFPAAVEIVAIGSWSEARALLDAEERESRIWDAHEAERERLWELATDRHTEAALLAAVGAAESAARDALGPAAARAAVRLDVQDARFAAEAVRAGQLAVHHAALAQLAGADAEHPFHGTLLLFADGRWPLGIVGGRLLIL